MSASAKLTVAVLAVLALTGCTAPGAPTPVPTTARSTISASSPMTTTPPSAFCLDLTDFQVAVVEYKAEVGQAINGQSLNVDELRRVAGIVASVGAEMQASAPADINTQFGTVLAGVAASAAALDKPGATVGDAVEPVYGAASAPAFDAIDKYRCH